MTKETMTYHTHTLSLQKNKNFRINKLDKGITCASQSNHQSLQLFHSVIPMSLHISAIPINKSLIFNSGNQLFVGVAEVVKRYFRSLNDGPIPSISMGPCAMVVSHSGAVLVKSCNPVLYISILIMRDTGVTSWI